MTAFPGFGELVARLSDHLRLDTAALARSAGLPAPELRAVFDGLTPTGAQLRRLAPALGLHTADLFAIADVVVPDELSPLDRNAAPRIPRLVGTAVVLPQERRDELQRFVRSLPQEPRVRPVPEPRPYERYEHGGGGALLMRMAANRNLGRTAAARTFLLLTGRYWSAATYGAVGRGRIPLTPDLVADFATVLGIPTGILAALTGIEPAGAAPAQDRATTYAAEIIWDARRLSADQLRRCTTVAQALKQH
ncbi:hypothetical protein [Kitasatospora sp. NPDC059571]|uniref:hypothetical protein n=1 Tax=Kitasatospora sp. NPDC059571 TaxID=3346871 RepID=UPI0036A7E6C5